MSVRRKRTNETFNVDTVSSVNKAREVFDGIVPNLGRRGIGFDALKRSIGQGLDVFTQQTGLLGFGMRELTAAVNRIYTIPLMLEEILGENYQSVSNRHVSVEEQSQSIAPAPNVPVNGNAPVDDNVVRKVFPFDIPRFAITKDITPDDVEALRAFASVGDVDSIQNRLMLVLGRIANRMKVSEELMRRGSIDGVFRMAQVDGSIKDSQPFYTLRGTAALTATLTLSNQATNVVNQFLKMKRVAERQVQGQGVNEWAVLCSSDVFDAITTHPSVEKFYLNWQIAQSLMEDNRQGGFRLNGNQVLYDVGNQQLPNQNGTSSFKLWADGTCKVVPVGTTESRNAPPPRVESVNKSGLPLNISTEVKKHGAGYEVLGDACYAAWNTQLEAITVVTVN